MKLEGTVFEEALVGKGRQVLVGLFWFFVCLWGFVFVGGGYRFCLGILGFWVVFFFNWRGCSGIEIQI